MWDLPGPGLEPVSPAWADGFLTTVPPGKPLQCVFMQEKSFYWELFNFVTFGPCSNRAQYYDVLTWMKLLSGNMLFIQLRPNKRLGYQNATYDTRWSHWLMVLRRPGNINSPHMSEQSATLRFEPLRGKMLYKFQVLFLLLSALQNRGN